MPGILRVDQANVDYIYAKTAGGKVYVPGHVVQVVHSVLTTVFSTTSTSMTSTGLTAVITPTTTSSKILAKVSGIGSAADANASQILFQLVRSGTIVDGQSAIPWNTSIRAFATVEGARSRWPVTCNLLDSPSTTSSLTYTLNMMVTGSTGYLGRWGTDGNWNVATTLTLMEIAQ